MKRDGDGGGGGGVPVLSCVVSESTPNKASEETGRWEEGLLLHMGACVEARSDFPPTRCCLACHEPGDRDPRALVNVAFMGISFRRRNNAIMNAEPSIMPQQPLYCAFDRVSVMRRVTERSRIYLLHKSMTL
jgi:hypothetical protein